MGRDTAWLAAAAIAVIGAALRVGPLGEFWLNGDEGLYDYIAHAPYELARVPIAHNAHPPGYFWLLRGVAWFGDDFIWLRLPAFLAGCATILVMFRLGVEVAGTAGGIAAAAMTAFSPAAVSLSHVVRQYALLDLLLAAGLWFFLRFLRDRRRRDLWVYAACLFVAFFVQYGSFVLPAGVGLLTLGLLATRRIDLRTAVAIAVAHLPLIAAAGLLFELQIRPNLVGQMMQREAVHGWLAESFSTGPGNVLASGLALFEYLAGPRFGVATAAAFLAGLVACVANRRGEIAGLVLATMTVAVALSLLELYPFGGTRHSFHLAPLVVLPLAAGVRWIVDRGARAALTVATALLALVVATGPVGEWDGLFGARPGVTRELAIPRREIADLHPIFTELFRSRGVTVTDLETIYMLSPVMRAANAWPSWFGTPSMAVYSFGEQLVVVAPVWHVTGGVEALRSPRQLAGVLRAIEAGLPAAAARLADGVTVISTDGARLLRSIPTLRDGSLGQGGMVEEIASTQNVSAFRLDVARYRATLDAQWRSLRREQLRKARRTP